MKHEPLLAVIVTKVPALLHEPDAMIAIDPVPLPPAVVTLKLLPLGALDGAPLTTNVA